ncbi:MAG: hypothetical protein IKE39_10285 [Cutibacterium sp.]|nr:hypothetical protein [Cutibacterium sp.]
MSSLKETTDRRGNKYGDTMQTLYEHSRRILAVFLIAALLCLAIIGPLPDTQSSATLTCTTTGIAAIFLVVVASHADPHFDLDSLTFIVTFLASAVCRRAATNPVSHSLYLPVIITAVALAAVAVVLRASASVSRQETTASQ